MQQLSRRCALAGASLGLFSLYVRGAAAASAFNIRDFGAKGDGATLDTIAIQRAIDTASAAGGGTVYLPAGRYLSFTLRLRSHITVLFDSGAVLAAADPAKHHSSYDLPEINANDQYEDYGHNYWRNSLMWGDGLEDVTVAGPGLIDGSGLTRESPTAPWSAGIGRLPPSPELDAKIADFRAQVKAMSGKGSKVIALKNSRNFIMRDVSILRAGHFGLLLTGVDNITLDNLKIDTNRDGIDLDVCRNARISNCTVNSPFDDGIVLKSSYALGVARPTENISITNCQVSGYDVGSLLDGTYRKSQLTPPLKHRTSGRIKIGTETNGGFRNIAVSNCVFDCCNGLAIESVDGGVLEDVVVSNLVMRDATAAPLFIRLGDRRRAPPGTPIAVLKRVHISNITCDSVDTRGITSTITGVPGAAVEDVTLRGMRWTYQGGGTPEQAPRAIPEMVDSYPDPDVFGPLPAWGLYARHVRGLVMSDIELAALTPDARKPVVTEDVSGLEASNVLAKMGAAPYQKLKL